MKVTVKLYGTLSLHVPEYEPSQGIEVEIPDGVTVNDLLTHLEIIETSGVAVIACGRVLKRDEKMQDGSSLDVFQNIQGGG
jgi:sulfur carrier protein ThiS